MTRGKAQPNIRRRTRTLRQGKKGSRGRRGRGRSHALRLEAGGWKCLANGLVRFRFRRGAHKARPVSLRIGGKDAGRARSPRSSRVARCVAGFRRVPAPEGGSGRWSRLWESRPPAHDAGRDCPEGQGPKGQREREQPAMPLPILRLAEVTRRGSYSPNGSYCQGGATTKSSPLGGGACRLPYPISLCSPRLKSARDCACSAVSGTNSKAWIAPG